MGPPVTDGLVQLGRSAEDDWRWQLRNSVRTVAELSARLELTPSEREGALAAENDGFPLAITPYSLALMDRTDPNCPIRRQLVPTALEGRAVIGDLRDPLGEEAHEVAPDLVQRYPDRVLLLATDRCAVYCRFCTRSRMVGAGGGARSLTRLDAAFAYIAAHPEIECVIVSGGDPLVMATSRLLELIERLRAIPHVVTIRLATRVPVALPMRIDDELLNALRPHHPLWVMTHFNHPRELTEASRAACRRLADAGFPVMNHTVLLRGVNDDSATLTQLFRGLVRERVRPYYLLQADPVGGTGHLRTPLETGLRIMGELQGRLSGIALPKFIVDTPHGMGKVPLVPESVVGRHRLSRDGTRVEDAHPESVVATTLRTWRGVDVDYVDPPV